MIYALPIFQAAHVVKRTETGRTKPVIIQCQSLEDTEPPVWMDVVAKLYARQPDQTRNLAREAIAAMLAHHFELPMPRAVIVSIDDEVIGKELPDGLRTDLWNSRGLNFGTEKIEGNAVAGSLPATFKDQAMNVFAFDMLISNSDRSRDNPNLLMNKNGLFLIDHALAFERIADAAILGNNDFVPWEFATIAGKKHVAYPLLKGQTPKFDRFLGRLHSLSDGLIDAMAGEVIEQWQSFEVAQIAQHLKTIRHNSDKFEQSLCRAIV